MHNSMVGLAVIGLTFLLELGWNQPLLELGWLKSICWNWVDFVGIGLKPVFVGIGLTLLELGWLESVNFPVNPIPTKKGHICWNWVDSTFCWKWVDPGQFSSQPNSNKIGSYLLELGWLAFYRKGVDQVHSLKSSQFQQKRVKFVGIGLTSTLLGLGHF